MRSHRSRDIQIVVTAIGAAVMLAACAAPIKTQANAYQYVGKVVERVDDVDLSPSPANPQTADIYQPRSVKEGVVAGATLGVMENVKIRAWREYQRYTVSLEQGEKVSLRSKVTDIGVGDCVRVWIRGPGVSPVYLYSVGQAEIEKATDCKSAGPSQ
jgi:hypothetical protein